MNWLKTHKNDLLLIAALLILGGGLALFLWLTRQGGGTVRVQMDGETVMELPLDRNIQIVLGSEGRTNTLVIEDGAARVTAAGCPDQICVNHGAIRFAGESIVCLPHKLVITVEGGQTNDVDAAVK